MSEKIIYEMGVVGVDQSIAKMEQFNDAASNINGRGFAKLNSEIATTGVLLNGLSKFKGFAIPNLSAQKKQLTTMFSPFTRRGTNSAIDQGLIPNIDLRDADLTHFAKNLKELREYRSHISAFNRNLIQNAFQPFRQKQLGWNGISYSTNKSDVFWYGLGTAVNDANERHQRAESERARLRKKWKKNNPWSDIIDVVEPTQNAQDEQPHYDIQAWNSQNTYRRLNFWDNIKYAANNAKGGNKGFFESLSKTSGITGKIGNIGKFALAFNLVVSGLAWLGRNIVRVVNAIKNFGEVILQARESWRQLRESHSYGTTMGSLAAQWNAMRLLGGDAASASALWNKLSSEIAMIGYGGSGGSVMDAARLFGLDIRGSGAYGYATPDELMRNVSRLMPKLDKAGQIALKKTLGLNDYQFWQVSNGEKYYEYLSNRPTLLGMLRSIGFGADPIGLTQTNEDTSKEIFSKEANDAARRFLSSWNGFIASLKELGGILGEALLPLLGTLLDLLNLITQLVSVIVKPIAWILNKLFSVLSFRFWEETSAMSNSPTTGSVNARIAGISAGANSNSVTLNIGDVSLNSLGLPPDATPEQVREKLQKEIFDQLGDHLINNRR